MKGLLVLTEAVSFLLRLRWRVRLRKSTAGEEDAENFWGSLTNRCQHPSKANTVSRSIALHGQYARKSNAKERLTDSLFIPSVNSGEMPIRQLIFYPCISNEIKYRSSPLSLSSPPLPSIKSKILYPWHLWHFKTDFRRQLFCTFEKIIISSGEYL